jgi:hypothetical protein
MTEPREFSCFDSEQDGWGNTKQWWEEWAEMKANQMLKDDLDERERIDIPKKTPIGSPQEPQEGLSKCVVPDTTQTHKK